MNQFGGKMREVLLYPVTKRSKTGIVLFPHKYKDGFFKAYKTNSRNDPEGKVVRTELELIALVRSGYHVRMSNIEEGHAPSTVKPRIIALK